MNEIIFENKDKILNEINDSIMKDTLNLLLIGEVPENFIEEVINLYYNKKYNCNYDHKMFNENILFIDGYQDINSSICNNVIHHFSKKVNIKRKFVIIYHFDNFSDILQANFKNYINNNIFYIFCTKSINKIYETIITRTKHIYFDNLSSENIIKYINNLSQLNKIELKQEDIDFILEKKMNKNEIKNIFNYVRLLNKVDIKDIIENQYCIDNKNIETYFNHIEKNDLKESIKILFNIHDKGYSLIDIYFFIYEYIKNTMKNENVIHLVAYYINKIYEGYDSKLSLVFFTKDCIKKEYIK